MARHRAEELTTAEACDALGLSKSQFHRLRASYLRACAEGRGGDWEPRASGGAHHPVWPPEAQELARRLLRADPPASYSLTASELYRRLGFRTDRSSVRRWALTHGCARPDTAPAPRAAVRRWQRERIGELWQMDATPHAFVPGSGTKWHLIEIMDDCSRLLTAVRLYEREVLASYFDLLPRAFLAHGLPLALYVDYHSFFHTQQPEALTEIGRALRFYGVSLQYASTPQAKGKIERAHQYWQQRLPPLFAAEKISLTGPANELLEQLRTHRNTAEVHRELNMTPHAAWEKARRAGRSVQRACRPDPWWHYVWSVRSTVRVADDGRVSVAGQRLRVDAPPRTRLVHCLHTNGSVSLLTAPPDKNQRPKVLLHVGPKLH